MKNEFNIKINQPANFEDTHDSLELASALEALNQATSKIGHYKDAFVESFIKTADEVLEYIPESQLDKYTVCDGYIQIFDKPYTLSYSPDTIEYPEEVITFFKENKRTHTEKMEPNGKCVTTPDPWIVDEEEKKRIFKIVAGINDEYNRTKRKIKECKTIQEQLLWINPTQKVFVVDTVNKKIELLWGLNKPSQMTLINDEEQEFEEGIMIKVEGEAVLASCTYWCVDYYSMPAPDAVWIWTNGAAGGYYNKTETRKGSKYFEIRHKFNIRNNKYEGTVKNDFIRKRVNKGW